MEIPWIRKLMKATVIMAVALLSLLATGMLVGVVFGDKIKQLAINELNKRLATEVAVNGSIDFSVLSNFPSASITFHEVTLKESLPAKEDLLRCDQISLLFNIWDIFKGEYSMKKVIVANGFLQLLITEDGNSNYNIFKSAGAAATNDFSIKVEEAILTNVLFQYDDNRSNRHFVFDIRQSALSGDFTSDDFLLSIQSDFISEHCNIDNIDYLPDRTIDINAALHVNLASGSYVINETSVKIESNLFVIAGKITNHTEGNEADLSFSGSQLKLEELATLLPEKYAAYIAHFKSAGTIKMEGKIKGLVSEQTEPHVEIRFGVSEGIFSHDKLKEPIRRVNLEGAFSNGASNSMATSTFRLDNFSASFDENIVKGMVLLRNFNDPYLEMNLDGEVNLELIKPMFPSTYILELKGSLTFRQFYFKGAVKELTDTKQIENLDAGGNFSLADVTIATNKTTYDQLLGNFDIHNNQIIINHLSFNAQESDLNFTGSIHNFIPYLMGSLNDSIKHKHKIGLDILLTSQSLSWFDLIGEPIPASRPAVEPASDYYAIPSLFYLFTGSVSGKIEKFQYDRFNAEDVHGKILFLGNTIYFNDFGMKAEKGSVVANGKLDISNMKRNRLEMTASLDKLDITQLFYEFNNFDQTTLTDKNLKGLITSSLALEATWDEKIFNKSKLYAIADVTVDNGELNNFDPMLALAKFVKLSELKNIRFSKLQNQVEIRNQKIFIPQMQIFTNALNLQLSGTHSFENIIDYKIQLNLLKLLTAKFEKSSGSNPQFDKSTEGFLNLYLTMTGPADSPLIRYDKKAVKEKIAEDLRQEKNELKAVLRKEFDQQAQDQQQIKDWQPGEKIQYMEFDEDSLEVEVEENKPTLTKQEQQKELENFKQLFKPKDPAPK